MHPFPLMKNWWMQDPFKIGICIGLSIDCQKDNLLVQTCGHAFTCYGKNGCFLLMKLKRTYQRHDVKACAHIFLCKLTNIHCIRLLRNVAIKILMKLNICAMWYVIWIFKVKLIPLIHTSRTHIPIFEYVHVHTYTYLSSVNIFFLINKYVRVFHFYVKLHLMRGRKSMLCRISRWFQIWPPFWPQRSHISARGRFLNSISNETIQIIWGNWKKASVWAALSIYIFFVKFIIFSSLHNLKWTSW